MMKKAIGALALLVILSGFTAPASAEVDGYWGWIYLSAVPDHYVCNPGETWAAGETRSIYVLLEAPAASWGASDAFAGIEFGMDYPSAFFSLTPHSPDAPAPLIIGGCENGHCSIQVGYGGGVTKNPHVAMKFDFATFGDGSNFGFYLLPGDLPSRNATSPVWSLDTSSPPIYAPQAGDGTADHPGWQQGFVVYNYDQATAPATAFPPNQNGSDWPAFNAGDPCARGKVVSNHESTWGALKAGY